MFKFMLKGVIFFMGIQSFWGRLQTEGVISGSIKINYSVLQEKIILLMKSDEMNGLIDRLNNSDFITPHETQAEHTQQHPVIQNSVHYVQHVVQRGETLSNLGDIYGIHWKKIKQANHIANERRLQIGQHLIIPVRMG